MIHGIQLVGGKGGDAVFWRFLEEDPCFGRAYAASAPECAVCYCPVVVDGKLMLLREACRAVCSGTEAGVIKKLTSRQIEQKFTQGETIHSVWQEILNGCNPATHGKEARSLLKDRCWYLENHRGMIHVDVPSTKELKAL